jgi:RimJ/RimL family protein N-acetyltransferase
VSALAQPNPQLTDGTFTLTPLTQADNADALGMCDDEDTKRFTFLPTVATPEWIAEWLRRYEEGWHDASRAGFAIRDADTNAFPGFAAIVRLDLPNQQGEIGYVVSPHARGRGAAAAAVDLLTRWAFDDLGLVRLELRIDIDNPASARVAEHAGYRLDGVLRSLAFKDGRRTDTAVWSRLASD